MFLVVLSPFLSQIGGFTIAFFASRPGYFFFLACDISRLLDAAFWPPKLSAQLLWCRSAGPKKILGDATTLAWEALM
jgi:hypothetical protein